MGISPVEVLRRGLQPVLRHMPSFVLFVCSEICGGDAENIVCLHTAAVYPPLW